MKPKFRHIRSFVIASSALLCIASAEAQSTLYWDANGTTAGAGTTPTGTWGTDNFWNTDSAGGAGTFSTATTSTSDVFFSAGTDAVNPYTVGLGAGTREARLVTFEDGTATLNNGTLSLGNQGGITVTANTVTGATISSGLTISGAQTFNVAASRILTLNTGTFTRNAGATLNVANTGTVTTTMSGLDSASLVNGIIGPWASFGSGASTRYATIDGSNNIVGYTGGTAAATAAGVTSATGIVNYDVAAVGTLGVGANINTLRYTGAGGTIAGALTTKGIMNVGGGTLTLSGTVSGGGELVVNTANGDIGFTSVLTSGTTSLVKAGSGRLGTHNAATTFTGNVTVNGGVLQYGDQLAWLTTGNITLNGGVIEQRWTATNTLAQGSGAGQIRIIGGESGFSENGATGLTWNIGAITWGSSTFNPSKFVLQTSASQSGSSVTMAAASTFNLGGATRTIVANSGAAGNAASTIAGIISNGGLIKEGAGLLTLSGVNTYAGTTTISAGVLAVNATTGLGNSSGTNTLIFNGGTLQAGGAITSAAGRSVTMTQTGIINTNGQAISIAGSIGGAGGLTKNGAGTLTLSGTNNYGGVTTVNAGTLQFANEVSLVSNTAANLNVKSGGTLVLNVGGAGQFTASTINTLLTNISVANTAAQGLQAGAVIGFDTTGGTFTQGDVLANSTGAFGGAIGLNKLGAGTLILDQANTYTGTTTISAGTLQFGSGGSGGSMASTLGINVGSGATFAVNQSDTVTQGSDFGFIFGAGSLANTGSGTLVLNAPNFHTGSATATAGNITLNNALAIQSSALNTTGAGTVTLGTGVTSPTFGGLTNSGTTRNLASVFDSSYSNATNITLAQASGSFTYGGVIADGATGMSLTKTGAGTQVLQGANTYTGDTFLNGGTLTLSGAAGALTGTTGLTFNGGALQLTNTTNAEGAVNRVSNTAGITSNGGTITYANTSVNPGVYAETVGSVALTSGQFNVVLNTSMAAGTQAQNNQTLTLAGLTRTGASNASAISFSALTTGPQAAVNRNMIVVSGAGTTTAGQIIGSWATTGTAANAQTDYAFYASNYITPAGIAGSAETTWTTAANAYTLGGATTLTGTRTITALRYSGSAQTFALGANNLETYGLLNGGSGLLTVSGTGALTTPTGGGNLFVTAGNNAITVSAPINNNGGNVTLVKSGSNTLTLGSTTSTYSGGTVINAGTLSYSADTNLGAGGSRNITFGGTGSLTWGFDGSSLGTLTVNAGAEGTLTSLNNITFATTTGSGTIRAVGGQNKLANLGNASAFTGNVALAYNANNNSGANSPHISFSSLNDAVGSSLQIYRQGGGTDSGQIGQIALAGNTGSLTFDNRQIQLLARTGGTGQSMATNYLLNNNATAANKWVINTNLLNLYDRDSTLGLGGNNTGDNAFNGLIGNSTATTFNAGTGVLSLAKTEAGTWILGNTANTYTGATTVSAGILVVKSLANGGLASSIGASSNAAANLLLGNGTTLRYVGAAATTDRSFTINGTGAGNGASLDASGTGAINFTNTASPAYGTGAQTRTLTLTGTNTGNNTLAANLADNSAAVSISKTGIGTWVLSGQNTNTGTTTISGGGKLVLDYTSDTTKLANGAALTLGGGELTLRGGSHLEQVGSLTIGNGGHTSITRDGGTAKLALGAISKGQSNGGTLSLAEDSLATTTTPVVNGILGGGITVGANWAKVDGGGNIIALTAGDYTALPTGSTTGTVNYQLTGSQTRAAGATLNSLRISGDGNDQVLTITSGNLQPSAVGIGALGNSGGILYAGGGNNNYTITGAGNIQAQNANQELIINTFQGTLTVDMALTMGSSILTKTGAGTLVLNKAGTYSGATYVHQGALRLRNATAAGTTAGGIFVQNNAALELANSVAIGAEALTITGTGVSDGGALRNVASNTSSYAGAITIGNGGARINSDASGALTLSGGVVTSINNNVTFGGAGNTTVQTVAISGAGGLVKDGDGIATLSATNTYTGTTTVSDGTLLVNGSVAAGAVSVASGATLGGTGTIAGTVNVSGVLSPGASIETLGTGTLSLANGSSLLHELDSSVATSVGSDLLKVTGNLNLAGTVGLTLSDFATTDVAFNVNDVFSVINYTGSWNGGLFTFEGNELADTEEFTFGLNTWRINYAAATGGQNFAGEYAGGSDSFVNLTVLTVIPEPSSVALLGTLGAMMLLRRRR